MLMLLHAKGDENADDNAKYLAREMACRVVTAREVWETRVGARDGVYGLWAETLIEQGVFPWESDAPALVPEGFIVFEGVVGRATYDLLMQVMASDFPAWIVGADGLVGDRFRLERIENGRSWVSYATLTPAKKGAKD